MSEQFQHGPLDFTMMPPAVKALIVANAAVYVLEMVVGGQFVRLFGLTPAAVVSQRWVWQPVTYLFLHGGLFHLLFNMFALWMFGLPVEGQWGAREFLKFFFLTGVGAGLVTVLVAPHSEAVTIGASGAIYGLLVAFAMLFPEAVVYLYFFFPIKAKHMAILFGIIEFASSSPGVARVAHLSGMVIGYLYIRWWWTFKLHMKSMFAAGAPAAPAAALPRRRLRAAASEPESGGDESAEVDRILDKILAHGESSLTERERDVLRRQARNRKAEGNA
ncbi:MAG: rhomboid family intramembrane serine protease [Elusimicrobia bacterium]|nr:rhomboid family intramembrane serine protease [Elusimicrobiota bacterium]